MSANHHDHEVDPIVKAIILKRAKRYAARAGFTCCVEEIAQHLFATLAEHFPLGPNDSPRGALLETVIDRSLANYARDRRAAKRRPSGLMSLSIIVDFLDDEGPVELAATISEREHDARHERRRRSDQEHFELRHDLAVVLAKLTVLQREISERLQYAPSTAQVARDLGIPRTTLYEHIKCIRQAFVDEGLAKYL